MDSSDLKYPGNIRIHFKDDLGLEEFLSSDLKQVFSIKTCDTIVETARIRDVLHQLQKNQAQEDSSGEFLNTFVIAENQTFLNCTELETLLNKKEYSTFSNLTVISFVDFKQYDCDLKVSMKNLFQFIAGENNKKVILVLPLNGIELNCEKYLQAFNWDCLLETTVTKICFQHLIEASQEYLLYSPCILYQDHSVSLKEFLYITDMSNNRLNSVIDSAVLNQLLCEQNELTQFTIHNNLSDFKQYTPRRFLTEISITSKIVNLLLNQTDITDFLIFGGIKDKETLATLLDVSEDLTHKIISNENIQIIQNFQEAHACFEDKFPKVPVHLIKCNSDKTLSWVDSKGSVKNIREFAVLKNEESINEQVLFEKKVVLLKGPPGAGKSTTLTKLSSYHPSAWIIVLDLLKYKDLINKFSTPITQRSVIHFFSECICGHSLTKGMLKDVLFHLKSRPVCLVFEGFDDLAETINAQKIKSFTNILRFLRRYSNASIFVSTRPKNSLVLEDALSIFGSEFAQIERNNQTSYFCKYWNVRLMNNPNYKHVLLSEYVENFFKAIHTMLGGKLDLFNTPTLLQAFAEYAEFSPESFPTAYVDIPEIVRKFVQQKYHAYLKSTGFTTEDTITNLNRLHGVFAFHSLFVDYKHLIEGQKEIHNSPDITEINLIWSAEDGSLKFIHSIFAEYFVADLVYTWLVHPTKEPIEELLITKILLLPQYRAVRLFLDYNFRQQTSLISEASIKRLSNFCNRKQNAFLNENREWALYVIINENLFKLASLFLNREFLRRNVSLFTSRNRNGKTVLILAAEHKQEHLIDVIMKEFSSISENYSHKLAWITLLETNKYDNKDLTNYMLEQLNPHLRDKLDAFNVTSTTAFNLVRENNLPQLQIRLISVEDEMICTYLLTKASKLEGTMLHLAASLGFLDIARYLLDLHTPVDVLDHNNATPLKHAAANGHLNVVNLLVTRGANVNIRNEYSEAPLLCCSRNGHLELVKYLLETGVEDVDACDREGMSALEHAAKSGYIAIVEILLINGCDINHRDYSGMSALAWAVQAGHPEVTLLLVNHGADSGIKDRYGLSLVNIAIEANQWHVVKLLCFCLNGWDVPDFKGVTPLERAIKSGQWNMVDYLILEGASVKCNKQNSFSPIKYALLAKKWRIVILMIERGSDLAELSEQILNHIEMPYDNTYTLFYKVIMLGNVELLELLIQRNKLDDLSKAKELDELLEQSYEELLLRHATLSEDMKWFVEGKLVQLRSSTERSVKLEEEDVRKRLILIVEQIRWLERTYRLGEDIGVDQEFIIRSRFIAEYIENIKRTKFLKNKGIPLEQIQFCLLIFLNFFINPESGDFCYRLLLDQDRMMVYLSNFADTIDCFLNKNEFLNHILSKYSEQIEADYRLVKDIYSLNRISFYINIAHSIENSQEVISPFVLTRCLQVIGESLKNTPDSLNLSNDVQEYLFRNAPEGVQDILTSLRDSLSHSHTLIARAELETRLKDDRNYFQKIQNDLEKIKPEINFMFYIKKLRCLEVFSKKCIESANTPTQLKKIHQFVDWTVQEDLSMENYAIQEVNIIKPLVAELYKIMTKRTEEEKELANSFRNEIEEIENNIYSRTNKMKLMYSNYKANVSNSSMTPIPFSFHLINQYLKRPGYQVAKNLVNKIVDFYFLRLKTHEEPQVFEITFKLYFVLNFDINRLKSIKEIRHFIPVSEEENIENLNPLFNKLTNMLKNNDDKEHITQHICEKLKVYELSRKVKDIDAVQEKLKNLDIKNSVKKNLIKYLKQKQFDKYYSTLGPLNYLGKLLKSSNNTDFHKELRNFFSYIDNPNVQSAINTFIENENKELERIYLEKLTVLQNVSTRKQVLGNPLIQVAIEMLLLDVLEILLTQKLLPEYTLTFEERVPVLVNRALRNYLAHGNLLIDTLPFKPLIAAISTVKDLGCKNLTLFTANISPDTSSKSTCVLDNSLKKNWHYYGQFMGLDNRSVEEQYELYARDENGDMMMLYNTLDDKPDLLEYLCSNRWKSWYWCFLTAAQLGDLKVLRHILDNILMVNKLFIGNRLCEALYKAAENGHDAVVELLLDYGANQTYSQKFTPLHIAALNGHESVVKQLLEHGACVNVYGKNQATPLYVAAYKGHTSVVQRLLDCGANIDDSDIYAITPLCAAAYNGHASVVKVLLKSGASVNMSDKNETTPLFAAAQSGYKSVVHLLLERGANINTVNTNQTTPLCTAAYNNHVSIVKLLLEKGADINQPDENQATPIFRSAQGGHDSVVELLLGYDVDVDKPDKDQATPLFIAAYNGYTSIIQRLLSKGANIGIAAKGGVTPVIIAAARGHKPVVKLLLSAGANINNCSAVNGSTPLCEAAKQGHESVVKLLLEKGARIDTADEYQCTPLILAAFHGRESVVRLLLELGAGINASCTNQSTALFAAAYNGCNSVVKLLLEHSAEIDKPAIGNVTPLYIASEYNHGSVVQQLLKSGADVAMASEEQITPLFVAAQKGHYGVIEHLINAGADINRPGKKGATPLFNAANHGHDSSVRLLLQHGANINASEDSRATPLYVAAQNGHNSVIKVLLEKEGLNINAPAKNDSTALHAASQRGFELPVQQLIKGGANVNALTADGTSPLFLAAQNGHESVVKLLLQHGANVDETTTDGSSPLLLAAQNGLESVVTILLQHQATLKGPVSPLHMAAQNGHSTIVKKLLENGADVNGFTNERATPLHLAAQNGHVLVVKELLQHGANVNARGSKEATALFFAAQNGHESVVEQLLKQHADTDACTVNQATPLIIAAAYGYESIVKLLLEYDASINRPDKYQATPLYYASENGFERTVELLLQYGANIDQPNEDQATPLFVAVFNEHILVVKKLLQYGANVNAPCKNQITAPLLAHHKGHESMLTLLFEHGATFDLPLINEILVAVIGRL